MPEGRLKIPTGDIFCRIFLELKIGSHRDKETTRASSSILFLFFSLFDCPFSFPICLSSETAGGEFELGPDVLFTTTKSVHVKKMVCGELMSVCL